MVAWLVGLIWNFFFWDNEFMVMGCDSWFCWSWVVRDGCYCQLLFLQRRERETKRKREKGMNNKERIKINKEYLNEVLKKIEPLMLGVL